MSTKISMLSEKTVKSLKLVTMCVTSDVDSSSTLSYSIPTNLAESVEEPDSDIPKMRNDT